MDDACRVAAHGRVLSGEKWFFSSHRRFGGFDNNGVLEQFPPLSAAKASCRLDVPGYGRSGAGAGKGLVYFLLCLAVLLFSNLCFSAGLVCAKGCASAPRVRAATPLGGMAPLADAELGEVRAAGLPDNTADSAPAPGSSNAGLVPSTTGSGAVDYSLFLARGLLPVNADISVFDVVYAPSTSAVAGLPKGAIALAWPVSVGAVSFNNIRTNDNGPAIGNLSLLGLRFSGAPMVVAPH